MTLSSHILKLMSNHIPSCIIHIPIHSNPPASASASHSAFRSLPTRHNHTYIIYNHHHYHHSLLMDFAPYQDTSPEHERALSPPPSQHPRADSRSPLPKSPPPNRSSLDAFPPATALPPPNHFEGSYGRDGTGSGAFRGGGITSGAEAGRLDINLFETSLPVRLDYEAMLAYLLLPPAGGVLLLVLEHKSDYVR